LQNPILAQLKLQRREAQHWVTITLANLLSQSNATVTFDGVADAVSDQFSNATPTRSLRRQINRHLRAVRKLSNDSSKIGGSILREFNLIRAPTLVTSHTSHPNTPRCAPKNNSTPLETAVLPVERRSISTVIRVLDKFLVDPMAAIMATPDLAVHEPAGNRAPGNDNRP
jgi:hypothetical protein